MKQSGLGDNLYIGGYDLSGDILSVGKISGSVAPIDVTSISSSAYERIGGLRDASLEAVSAFNPSSAHPVLSALPTSAVPVIYCRGTTLGGPAAALIGRQVGYDPTRGADGQLTMAVQVQGSGYGLEWGRQVAAGPRIDTAATEGDSIDGGAATAHGWQAYLQVLAFTGDDVTIALEDSADDSSFTALSGGAFTEVTAAPATERLASATSTATLRQYVRVTTSTSAGFDSVTFCVVLVRNEVEVLF